MLELQVVDLSSRERKAVLGAVVFTAAAVGLRVLRILQEAKEIDGYAPLDPSAGQRMQAQPGVLAFQDFVLLHYGGGSAGIVADESHPPSSLHTEGRAFDWVPDDPADADRLLADLLKADLAGNPEAGARRVGLAQIIHRDQIWIAGKGWRQHTGAYHPHVHLGFGWPGAKGQTSWFA